MAADAGATVSHGEAPVVREQRRPGRSRPLARVVDRLDQVAVARQPAQIERRRAYQSTTSPSFNATLSAPTGGEAPFTLKAQPAEPAAVYLPIWLT